MRQISMKGLWVLLKANFRLSIQNKLILAVLYLRIVPILRSIENLDEAYAADCLEQSVIPIGIILLVPLYAVEQYDSIREVIITRKIPQWMILLIRMLMAILMLTLLTGIFAGIMIRENSTFPYMSYVAGTVISELALGSVGFLAAALSNSLIIGYFVSIGYFLFNYLGYIAGTDIFCLFSVGTGNFGAKAWLLGISILWMTIALAYIRKNISFS